MTQPRVLHRPPQGWGRRNPNWALPEMLAFVGLCFGAALFFNWASAALDCLLSAL